MGGPALILGLGMTLVIMGACVSIDKLVSSISKFKKAASNMSTEIEITKEEIKNENKSGKRGPGKKEEKSETNKGGTPGLKAGSVEGAEKQKPSVQEEEGDGEGSTLNRTENHVK